MLVQYKAYRQTRHNTRVRLFAGVKTLCRVGTIYYRYSRGVLCHRSRIVWPRASGSCRMSVGWRALMSCPSHGVDFVHGFWLLDDVNILSWEDFAAEFGDLLLEFVLLIVFNDFDILWAFGFFNHLMFQLMTLGAAWEFLVNFVWIIHFICFSIFSNEK